MAADEFVDRCRLFHGFAGHAILTFPPGARMTIEIHAKIRIAWR